MIGTPDSGAKHVVHLTCSAAFAGVERYVSLLAPHQAERGWRVTVIGGATEPMKRSLEGTDVRFLPAATLRSARAALRSVSRADIVNTHMSNADLAGIMASVRSDSHLVSTRHFAAPRGGSRPIRAAFGMARRRFAAQISISHFVAGSIGEPSSVVHTGVTDAAAGACGRRVVLMAQRLEPEKATDVAIAAWAASRARDEGWELHIAGDGSERVRLQHQAAALGVRDSVRFLGHQENVRALMPDAGVFLAPTAREGLGLSVLEAMACALPIVASSTGGHAETIGSVEGALLFQPDDVRGAARLLDVAVADAECRRRYGLRAQRVQRERFTVHAQADATLAVYEGCLS
ncbi:glycosyltransferase family 4 protein [Paramicrobacterium agarici]|uniref:glycosyltransferase family 4 protein n=1 Tax=Paramicrobacterium agarici TaxID=630514 RepID=UPI00116CE06F|nr:glycosyltransferase family 4 protein [Microbacterium agarici]TQO23448.1 glycosyltransferase involved in cell wall biosynthesis [Microbacterium agarici]